MFSLPLHFCCYCCCCFSAPQVAGGLLPEALLLLRLGLSPNSHVATKAIGYRQACEFMQVERVAFVYFYQK